jgi:DNA ligase-associated metallophosphoesterase
MTTFWVKLQAGSLTKQRALSDEGAMTNLSLMGVPLTADHTGALFLPEERLLAAADLHLEKGSAFAARGQMLPPYDTHATLARLMEVITRLAPAHVVLMGDTFHDTGAEARMGDAALLALKNLMDRVPRWTWLLGNHDPHPPSSLGGEVLNELTLGPLVLRHEPAASPCAGEIAGHLHPAARVVVRGRSIRRRCFVTDGERLILPAFGAYAGGLDVFDPALRGLFGPRFAAFMLGAGTVHAMPSAQLARPVTRFSRVRGR